MTAPRPNRRDESSDATIEPISAPTPIPAVTKPIAAGATCMLVEEEQDERRLREREGGADDGT